MYQVDQVQAQQVGGRDERTTLIVRAVVSSGGLTRASEALGLTLVAHHQLRDAEERLGTSLFHRVGKRLVPTPAGARVLESADRVIALVDETEAALCGLAGPGPIRLSVESYASYHWLGPVLTHYGRLWPDVELQIESNGGYGPRDRIGRAHEAIDLRARCQPQSTNRAGVDDRAFQAHRSMSDSSPIRERIVVEPRHEMARLPDGVEEPAVVGW
jgi:DNA-binding transcriptional LysR family regulator